MTNQSPLIIFLILVVLFVLLTPGIIINIPPTGDASQKDSWLFTGTTSYASAVIHGIIYAVIVMSAIGIISPYANIYGPSHMYNRYKELYGVRQANAMTNQFKNLGQPSALSGMPGKQTSFWSRLFGRPPGMMGPLGPVDGSGNPIRPGTGLGCAAGASNPYVGSFSPVPNMMPGSPMMPGMMPGSPMSTPIMPPVNPSLISPRAVLPPM